MEWLLEQLREFALTAGARIIAAAALLIIGFKLTNFFTRRLEKRKLLSKADPTAAGFIKSFISIIVKALLIVTAITILGVPMSSIVAVIASAGVAIGLAVQGALSNLAGGIMILLFKPFKVGDYISSGDSAGTVRTIGVFYTEVVTLDNRVITLPNGSLTNSVVVNYSKEDLRRVDIVVPASYDNDVDEVKQTLIALVRKTPGTLEDPEPVVLLTKYSESSVDYTIRVWCKSGDYWPVYNELIDKIKKVFDAVGIKIPYQQLDVHIKER